MKTSEAVDKIFAAMADAQAATGAAAKDNTNPAFRSKYADLTAHVEVIKPAAKTHKIAVFQELTSDDSGVHVTTRFAHPSGQWIEFGPLYIPANKHDAQGFGSAASYARRYALSAAWGTVADDDDGNAAVQSAPQKAAKQADPAGFAEWLVDLEAVAAEGMEALKAAWTKSKPVYRTHLTSTNNAAWEALKAKATPKVAA